jgi:hypothetical protein
MSHTRRIRRARARQAYDRLSRSWRAVRRNQDALVKIGMFEQSQVVVGRKPPFTCFLQMTAEVDPFELVGRGTRQPDSNTALVQDVLEYAREHEVEWRGRDARLETRRGVETIPIAGDDD